MEMAAQAREQSVGVAGVAKWQVGERREPRSRRELTPRGLLAKEAHPLAMAAGSTSDSSAPTQEEKEVMVVDPPGSVRLPGLGSAGVRPALSRTTSSTSDANKQELVVLQDGDMDPLGVLSASQSGSMKVSDRATLTASSPVVSSGEKAQSASSTLGVACDAAQPTVKQRWKAHTDRLLAKYAEHTFKIKASMLEVSDLESTHAPLAYLIRSEISFVPKSAYQKTGTSDTEDASVIKKTRARLEQLERSSSHNGEASAVRGEETVEISQKQYVAKVKEMQTQLVACWERNQKVAALRIAIKCVKLLADTDTAPQLYPCVFVLVSEVLDAFGKLVFGRIRARASEDENGQPLSVPLSENFTSSDVNVHAMETCRNWFYKTACIRELLPRIYIEIALLGCYRFLCDGEYPQIVARLSNMIKGVGEPMVALYARLYLALTSSELLDATAPAEQTAVISSSLFDYFYAFDWFRQHQLKHWLLTHTMDQTEYLALHSPAVEWLVKCTVPGATQVTFDTLLAHYQQFSDSSMVLKHLCECFGAQFYAEMPSEMLELIRTASPSQYSTCHLYSLLALQLSNAPTVAVSEAGGKLQFLNNAWASITLQEDIEQYMECAAAYMKLIVAHFSHREALILMKDVVRHLNTATPEQLTARTYNLMGALIENVVFGAQQHFEFFTKLIPSAGFLALMGMFKRESSVGVAKKVLQAFVGGSMKKSVDRSGSLRLHVVGPEAAVAHTLLVICCRVHDALDSLSTTSERTEATRDIGAFITRLGYVKTAATATERALDEEQEALLMLYTDCRRSFYKLEPIKALLSRAILRLAMHMHKRLGSGSANEVVAFVAGGGKKRVKTRRNFIQSCLAFAHITIPSIEAPLEKLELLISAANVALVANCIPQMDALLKAAIVQLSELHPDVVHSLNGSGEDSGLSTVESSTSSTSRQFEPTGYHVCGSNNTERVVQLIAQLMSVVVYAPSLNDEDAFYFVLALHKAIFERMTWTTAAFSARQRLAVAAMRVRVLLLFVQLYALWGQKTLPRRLKGVDSNDVLYGGNDAFYDEVQLRFSSTIEEVVHGIEALEEMNEGRGEADETSGSSASVVLAAQIELMLDFVNEVVPVLEYDESRMRFSPLSGSLGAGDGTGSGRGGSRRRKRPRCGAALVRKCMAYSHDKVGALQKEASNDAALTLASWSCRYFETTRGYVGEFMLELRKDPAALALDPSSQQAVQTLGEALSNLWGGR